MVYLNTETEHCTSCGEEMEFSIAHTELQPVIMCRRSPQPWKVEFEWAVRNLKKHNFRYNAYVLALAASFIKFGWRGMGVFSAQGTKS